ncbi:hypothetical protein [Persicirhabdus sediminis]|nr:hypothetical protein [Persicirhabdus sediminis]
MTISIFTTQPYSLEYGCFSYKKFVIQTNNHSGVRIYGHNHCLSPSN